MRLLDTKTRYFDQDTFQVPKLNNTWGCMVDFLDAALVYGSPSQPILGITVTEDVKEPELYWLFNVQLNSGHGFKANLSVVEILNANIPTFNKVYRVQEITDTSITLAVLKTEYPTKPLDLVYVDGVEIKTKALGYEKIFEAPQKAVYKVTTASGKFCYLRVDNSCPTGWDPSWAKFSRISMYEDMRNIDDYQYRIGIKKAPAYRDDYTRVEDKVYNIWVGTNDTSSGSQFYLKRSPNGPNLNSIIIGDSSTFYFHRELITTYGVNVRDETYAFGSYIKHYYKEDHLPFILRCSQLEGVNSETTLLYNRSSGIHRDRDWCNHTFSTEESKIYETPSSDRFALWLTDSFKSGRDTRVNFIPYKNELPFNLIDFELRFFRPNNVVLEGRYRGLKGMMNNFQDYLANKPTNYTVFSKNLKELYLTLPCREYFDGINTDCFAIDLKDWEDT